MAPAEYKVLASTPTAMDVVDHRSDELLLAQIALGDRDAFAALYRRRRPDVYRFALHMIGSRCAAEDVVQDVFLAVIHDANRFEPSRAAALPWLLGIARNHVRRWMDRSRRTISLDDEGRELVASLAGGTSPAADLEQRDDVAMVRRALIRLPVKYREAIVLCDLRELSYADAAVVLKCAIGTVRSRLHRGRTLLARRIAEADGTVFQAPVTRLIV